MTYDPAAIMTTAWDMARRERNWSSVEDWTQKGLHYGRKRPTTSAERRVLFASCLRRAWAAAHYRVAAQRRFAAEQTPEGRALVAQIEGMENRDHLTFADFQHMDALRHQIDMLAGIA